MSDAITIPYQNQDPSSPHRMCGAAALSMVYASFGKIVPQAEVWPKISKHNRFGSLTAASHLIAQDALGRGFSARQRWRISIFNRYVCRSTSLSTRAFQYQDPDQNLY